MRKRKARQTSNAERRTPSVEWLSPINRLHDAALESYGDGKGKKQPKCDLKNRLLDFAVKIIELTDDLPSTRAANHFPGQLLRSGTSPYGKHGEVESAESRKDFIHKLRICLKELRETRRWLRLLARLQRFKAPRNPTQLLERDAGTHQDIRRQHSHG
jgi:four helix bundle protein